MQQVSDPEISAAFSSAPTVSSSSVDPEIDAAFKDSGNKQAPKKSWSERIADAQMYEARSRAAAGSAGLTMASGSVAAPVAGLAGIAQSIYNLGNPNPSMTASDRVSQVNNALTFQPHDQLSADTTNIVAYPFQKLNQAGDWLGRNTAEISGYPALGAAVNAGFQVGLPYAVGRGASALSNLRSEPIVTGEAPASWGKETALEPGDVPVPANAPLPRELDVKPSRATETVEAPVTSTVKGDLSASPTGARQPAYEPQDIRRPQEAFVEPNDKAPSLEVGPDEQARRMRVLSEINLNDGHRASALTGDPLAQSTDYQISLNDSPAGRVMKSALDKEKGAITEYSTNTVNQTGGRVGSDQTTNIRRGDAVTGALESLNDSYDSGIKELYSEADKRAKGIATSLDGFKSTLADDSLMTNQDRMGLRGGLNAYLKKLGVVDDNGNITASVQQAETIRKYINNEWTPQNSRFAGALKDALDDDVTKDAGSDIYQKARALRAEKARVLDDPKGISNLLDTSGPNGVNRKVASDNVMRNIETMPPEQLGHIVSTLRQMASDTNPELASKGSQALSEIKAHFAQRAHDIGTSQQTQWNVKGYNQFLKDNSEALATVFKDDPETLHRMFTANEAGKILHYPTQYPGAANQASNLIRSGILPNLVQKGVAGAGGFAGGLIGGPWGAAGGSFLGDQVGGNIAGKMGESAAVRSASKRLVNP